MTLTSDAGFLSLLKSRGLGEPLSVGESFNKHYMTDKAFIKVSRPHVLPFRATNDVYFAHAMADLGVPTARPLVDHPLEFQDQEGYTRWVTIWEKKTASYGLDLYGGSLVAQEWIEKLWALPAPEWTTELSLDSFLHATHVRLDGVGHPLVEPLVEALTELSKSPYYYAPNPAGLLHGDLHNGNLMATAEGVILIDWESACLGPKEWDAAQNLRYADPAHRQEFRDFWLAKDEISEEALDFYYRLRSLTSMTHFIASGLRPRYYYDTLALMGWEEMP